MKNGSYTGWTTHAAACTNTSLNSATLTLTKDSGNNAAWFEIGDIVTIGGSAWGVANQFYAFSTPLDERTFQIDGLGVVTDQQICITTSPTPTRTPSTSGTPCNFAFVRYGSSQSAACSASNISRYLDGPFSNGTKVYTNSTCTSHAPAGGYSNGFSTFSKTATGGLSSGNICRSDRRLKKNINLIGKSPSGINIYSFEYIDSKWGKGVYQGVMAQEVPHATVHQSDGYLSVDYSKVDVEFKEIK